MTDPAPVAVCPVCDAERPARTFWWFQPRDHLVPGVACDECYQWAQQIRRESGRNMLNQTQ